MSSPSVTATAKGLSHCAPVPSPRVSGSMPSAAAGEVMSTGRRRARRIGRVLAHLGEHEDAVLGHDADADDGAEEGDDGQVVSKTFSTTKRDRALCQQASGPL